MVNINDVEAYHDVINANLLYPIIRAYKVLVLKDSNNEPLDGDETEKFASILKVFIDFNEGNVTSKEADIDLKNIIGGVTDAKDSVR
jgi:hypothetical protein